jgi:hypothetical protein
LTIFVFWGLFLRKNSFAVGRGTQPSIQDNMVIQNRNERKKNRLDRMASFLPQFLIAGSSMQGVQNAELEH